MYSILSADSILPTRALWASLGYLNPAAELRLFREKLKMTQIASGCRARRLLRLVFRVQKCYPTTAFLNQALQTLHCISLVCTEFK